METDAPTSHADRYETKRMELIEDVARRKSEAQARLEHLRVEQFALLRKATQASDTGFTTEAIELNRKAGHATAEFRKLDHIVIPGLIREFESIQTGAHSSLAVLGASIAGQRRVTQRSKFEEAVAHFTALCTPEFIKAAQQVVDLATEHLELPSEAAVVIAKLAPR